MQTPEVARDVDNWQTLFGQEKSALVIHTFLQTFWTNHSEVCFQHLWGLDMKFISILYECDHLFLRLKSLILTAESSSVRERVALCFVDCDSM